MSANIDAVLARLDEMNNGEINYEVYRELHDLVSAIEDDVQAPIELFPGTLEALDALSIRARTTSPDAATEELDKVTLDRLQELAEELERAHDLIDLREFEIDNLHELISELRTERDAALAAIERVRAIAERHGVKSWTEEIFAALDGAPEPEEKQ